jgi:hypothetical protein
MPRHRHPLSRLLIALLNFRQPVARGWARYSVRLKAKVMKREAEGYQRTAALPFDPADGRTLRYWHDYQDRLALLHQIKNEVFAAGWRMRVDSGWHDWDMEIYGSRYVKVRLTTATEQHHGRGMLTRVRVELRQSRFGQVLMIGAMILAGLLMLDVWPFSRPAVLIPLAWWAMYLINRRKVTTPILGLIDHAAEAAGYMPLLPSPRPVPPEVAPQPSSPPPAAPARPAEGPDLSEEDGQLSAV